jgi:hypothetical protein
MFMPLRPRALVKPVPIAASLPLQRDPGRTIARMPELLEHDAFGAKADGLEGNSGDPQQCASSRTDAGNCANLPVVIEKRAIAQIFAIMPGQVEGTAVRAAALRGSPSNCDKPSAPERPPRRPS